MRGNATAAVVLLGAGLLAACDQTTMAAVEDRSLRIPGVLQLEGFRGTVSASFSQDNSVRWTMQPESSAITPTRVLQAPDTVQAGQTFQVTVLTIGSSGCWREDGQDIRYSGRTVELRPYDRHSGADLCTTALVQIEHRSTLQLDAVGEWTLKVTGRRAREGDVSWSEPVSAEKTIVVR